MKKRLQKILHGKKPFFFLGLYLSDVIMFLIAMYVSFLILNKPESKILDFYLRTTFFSLLILVVNYSAFGLYDEKRTLFDDNQFMNILFSIAITYAIIVTFT